MKLAIELEYTPWPTASPALRAVVADAFERAELPIAREMTAPGGDGPLPAGYTWAPTYLIVRFVVTDAEAANGNRELSIFSAVCPRLKVALGMVRRLVPELPLGLMVIANQRRTHYAFAIDDSSEDVQAAIDALVDRCDHDQARVHGWYRAESLWKPI